MGGPAFDCVGDPLAAVRWLFARRMRNHQALTAAGGAAGGAAAAAVADDVARGAALPQSWEEREEVEKWLQAGNSRRQQLPDISRIKLDSLQSSKALVRYRGMIQDMLDPEFYVGAYQDLNGTWHTTKYSDAVDLPPHHEGSVQIWERRVLYCVPVPGENVWVHGDGSATSAAGEGMPAQHAAPNNDTSTPASLKRQRDDSMEVDAVPAAASGSEDRIKNSDEKEEDGVDNDGSRRCSTRQRPSEPSAANDGSSSSSTSGGNAAAAGLNLNLPLGDAGLAPCLVKVYDSLDSDLKLNDVVEFVGCLSFQPRLAAFAATGQPGGDSSALPADVAGMEGMELDDPIAAQIPASKVPWLHAISLRKVEESFQAAQHQSSSSSSAVAADVPPPLQTNDFPKIRSDLLRHLSLLLGGDNLAAEYLLLHLLSKVHTRVEPLALGQLSLNLSRATQTTHGSGDFAAGTGRDEKPSSSSEAAMVDAATAMTSVAGRVGSGSDSIPDASHPLLTTLIPEAVSLLLPRSHNLDLTVELLNGKRFCPKKDYATNRLSSGLLQLPLGLHLTINETALKPGQLTESGTQNLNCLKDMMQSQKVPYDFEFYNMEMTVDIPVLVLSEAKSSLLPCDVVLPLLMSSEPVPLMQSLSSSSPPASSLPSSASLLDTWREFIATARSLPHKIEPDLQKVIEDELVRARQEDRSVGSETFHRWLTLARLMASSYGEEVLTKERWEAIRSLEHMRNERLRVV